MTEGYQEAEPNSCPSCRLLHCLAAATHPLRVKELAEDLAVHLDDVEGIPKLKPEWRWEDQEQSILESEALADAGSICILVPA